MPNCIVPNCARTHEARGHCRLHYRRLMRHGDPTRSLRAPTAERFSRYVTPGNARDCWEWRGGRDRDGYGTFYDRGRPIRAHRWVYQHTRGVELPPQVQVRHRCDNPPCVNPDHLLTGSNADNIADKVERGRGRGNPTGNVGNLRRRLTDEQVALIRASTEPRPVIARAFGVSREHIRRIQNGTRR